jgi:hypothetical protein
LASRRRDYRGDDRGGAGYRAENEKTMRASLPEDHRRRYAALEALKLGRGGIMFVDARGINPGCESLVLARNSVLSGTEKRLREMSKG